MRRGDPVWSTAFTLYKEYTNKISYYDALSCTKYAFLDFVQTLYRLCTPQKPRVYAGSEAFLYKV